MILVGSDGHELALGEVVGPEVLRSRHVFRLGGHVNHVETRLVLVHRVEDDLNKYNLVVHLGLLKCKMMFRLWQTSS